jgi:hypothetical protein
LKQELWESVANVENPESDIPVATDEMGGMLCRIVKRISWWDERTGDKVIEGKSGILQAPADNGSTTFVAKVLATTGAREDGEPLMYYRRKYVEVGQALH